MKRTKLIIFILILMIFLIFAIRVIIFYNGSSYDKYCKFVYGKGFYYKLETGTSSVCLNNSERHYFFYVDYDKICKFPKFYELNKWKVECNEK